jgi:hypothetical protein
MMREVLSLAPRTHDFNLERSLATNIRTDAKKLPLASVRGREGEDYYVFTSQLLSLMGDAEDV